MVIYKSLKSVEIDNALNIFIAITILDFLGILQYVFTKN